MLSLVLRTVKNRAEAKRLDEIGIRNFKVA